MKRITMTLSDEDAKGVVNALIAQDVQFSVEPVGEKAASPAKLNGTGLQHQGKTYRYRQPTGLQLIPGTNAFAALKAVDEKEFLSTDLARLFDEQGLNPRSASSTLGVLTKAGLLAVVDRRVSENGKLRYVYKLTSKGLSRRSSLMQADPNVL